ncbi:uncharacterized protein LOC144695464 [Cetorhinus maximus]
MTRSSRLSHMRNHSLHYQVHLKISNTSSKLKLKPAARRMQEDKPGAAPGIPKNKVSTW